MWTSIEKAVAFTDVIVEFDVKGVRKVTFTFLLSYNIPAFSAE